MSLRDGVLLVLAWVAWVVCLRGWVAWVEYLSGWPASVGGVGGMLTWNACYYYCYCYY